MERDGNGCTALHGAGVMETVVLPMFSRSHFWLPAYSQTFFFLPRGIFAGQKAEVAELFEVRMQWVQRTDFVNEKCSGASRRLEREKDGSPFIGWVHREGGYGVSRDTGALAPPTMVSEQQNQGWEGPSLGRMGFSVVASLTLGRAKDIGTAVCVSPVMTEGKLPPALQERALSRK